MNKKFALIGVCGYIAPRHLKAIKETGNVLTAALDKSDSAGVLDSYFPDTHFFTEFERFDRHLEKQRRKGEKVDYVTICSPNYLHDAHARFGMRIGADVICEKPVVLNPWNIEALSEIEKETGRKINVILQLRLHPAISTLREKVLNGPANKIYDIDLTYIAPRGRWYMASWKGDSSKSGGIATNIGIHFFDMLTWIFGDVKKNIVHISEPDKAAGLLELKKAKVRWFLSIDGSDSPAKNRQGKMATYRSISVNQQEIEFSGGFTDLHIVSYEKILASEGFTLKDSLTSVEIVSEIRCAKPIGLKGDYHPLLKTIKITG